MLKSTMTPDIQVVSQGYEYHYQPTPYIITGHHGIAWQCMAMSL